MPGMIKSYRLDEALVRKVGMLARRHGLTESQLVSKWISDRALLDCLDSPIELKIVGAAILSSILGAADANVLELVGWELGEKQFAQARAAFEAIGERLSFREFVDKILADEMGWFRYDSYASPKSQELVLEHDLSNKWSIFLKGYLSGAFESVSKERMNMIIGRNFVKITLPRDYEEGS